MCLNDVPYRTDWLTDWLTDWPTDWLTDWPTGWLSDWRTGWLAGWLGWLAARSPHPSKEMILMIGFPQCRPILPPCHRNDHSLLIHEFDLVAFFSSWWMWSHLWGANWACYKIQISVTSSSLLQSVHLAKISVASNARCFFELSFQYLRHPRHDLRSNMFFYAGVLSSELVLLMSWGDSGGA